MPPSLPQSGQRPPLQDLEWEVLPPEDRQPRSSTESAFKLVSLVMDRLIRIPGLKKRLGLNPIVDLVPGFGDIAVALVSVSVIIYGIRRKVPKIVLGRMALNVLINELVGLIPIIGSAFAFWFQANTRNYHLIRGHIDTPGRSTKGDKIFVGVILALVVLAIVGGIFGTFLFLQAIAKLISG
ncbi:MAG TPA: DUF4112 domain-containing protein [Chthoniobacterales bacterium]|nr:DUF4112 domain-containing protein [Chthoniobacterales bacterium]